MDRVIEWELAAETVAKLAVVYGDEWKYLTTVAQGMVIADSLLGKAQGDEAPLPPSVVVWAQELVSMSGRDGYGVER